MCKGIILNGESLYLLCGCYIIATLILLKKNKPFLQRISSSSRINESPYGAIENCKVFIKTYFSKDINFYVDKYIFDLSDKEKSKICSKIKLTH